MEIHHPSPSELQKMDDLIAKIQLKPVPIRDGKLSEKEAFMVELRELVREWSYIPWCAKRYFEVIPITPQRNTPTELQLMDEIINKIQAVSLDLRTYQRLNIKNDEQHKIPLDDTVKTKIKLLNELWMLVKDWPHVPVCAEPFLKDLHVKDWPYVPLFAE